MSKRLIALSIAVALLCCACPMIAFAANETTGESDVFVTFSGFGDGDEPNETAPTREEPDVRGYEINIPASYSTNEAPFMAITANFISVGVW